MAKTASERAREYKARKRSQARESGLCLRCFKGRPLERRTICRPCRADISENTRRRRREARKAESSSAVARAHELAGDIASEHGFYGAAVHHYQHALENTLVTADYERVSKKLAAALPFSGDRIESNRGLFPWQSSTLQRRTTPSPADVAEILLFRSQNYPEGSNESALTDAREALSLAESSGDRALSRKAVLAIVSRLRNLGRRDEADGYLKAIGNLTKYDDLSFRVQYWNQLGIIYAQDGRAAVAYRRFDLAAAAAEKMRDGAALSRVLANKARFALTLGDTMLAKVTAEQALLMSRQSQTRRKIPVFVMVYVEVLWRMGQLEHAYHYLREALQYASSASPSLAISEFGIALAAAFKDGEALARCNDPRLLERAFRSGSPAVLAPVASAFSRYYSDQGNTRKAALTIRRAMGTAESSHTSWDLCLEVARQGVTSEIPRARALLRQRIGLPRHAVAAAYLALFEALVALQRGDGDRAQMLGKRSAESFHRLQWHAYGALASQLLSLPGGSADGTATAILKMDDERLTGRQRDVATLAMRGLSNRAIAAELGIKETTVESHMAAVIAELGIRSRFQIQTALGLSE